LNRGARLKKQRSNRVRLKADAHHLLRKIIAEEMILVPVHIHDEITEMMVRLQPKPGVAARIELTGYTK
jgi:hypothetical protein